MPSSRNSGDGREAGALAGALTGVRDKVRARSVTAVLGPTNTGKTYFAIERMVSHPSGIIGLPLRLLAREVYGRVCDRVGAEHVALITGEEKIKPKGARYWICTVEAMPRDLDVSFVAIDEIQLAADLDRGHVFTDRLLHRRGLHETLVIGASTMQRMIEKLLPGVTIVNRPRLSKLTFAGEKKLSRLPHRTAIVAFSAEEVYAIAELIRRQRGGAAVVLGALSPRTRNAQVEMYQNGDVDYLVATDAIGMGLNLDVDHVAFAGDRKFDGWQYRRLNPAELGQIAGRAGRHLKDGTFGTTGRCPGFDEDLVEALEDHRFDPLSVLQWRNSDLDFSTIEALQASLELFPHEPGLTRAPLGEDLMVLDIAARDEGVRRGAKTRADVARLWDVCQVPDYRKVSPAAHADFAVTLYGFVVRAGRVPDSWYAQQVAMFDRTEGDIDALSARIAQVRTLTYIANRPDWLGDPEHWQGVTRQLEDRLSDALHERLAQRFVDRRTSVLMRRLRENAMLEAEITAQGDVLVEGQHVGQLHGFRFTPDPLAAGEAARTLNAAAMKALGGEIDTRADRFSAAVDESFALANDGTIRWLGDPVAKLTAGDKLLVPRARIVSDEHLTGPALETVQRRLDLWLAQHVKKHLGPLMELESGDGLEGIVRGIAFQVAEALGVLERSRVADDMKTLDQSRALDIAEARPALRCLPHLPSGPGQTGTARARCPALGFAARRCRDRQGARRGAPSRGFRAHLLSGRPGCSERPLSGRWVSGLRRARRPGRHSRAAGRPDQTRHCVSAGNDARHAAVRHRGQRRLRHDRADDVAGGLLRRGLRVDPEGARLRARPSARTGHHRPAACRRTCGAPETDHAPRPMLLSKRPNRGVETAHEPAADGLANAHEVDATIVARNMTASTANFGGRRRRASRSGRARREPARSRQRPQPVDEASTVAPDSRARAASGRACRCRPSAWSHCWRLRLQKRHPSVPKRR